MCHKGTSNPWHKYWTILYNEIGYVQQAEQMAVVKYGSTHVTTHPRWDIFRLISIKISLKFVPKGTIDNIPTLVQIMAWRRLGDKPLSEPMVVRLPTHMCLNEFKKLRLFIRTSTHRCRFGGVFVTGGTGGFLLWKSPVRPAARVLRRDDCNFVPVNNFWAFDEIKHTDN